MDIEGIVSASDKLYVPTECTATAGFPRIRKEGRRERHSQKGVLFIAPTGVKQVSLLGILIGLESKGQQRLVK